MTKPDLHILILEDEALDAELNKAQLALLDEYNCIIDVLSDRRSFLLRIRNNPPDIVLSDYNLPQYNGLTALKDLKDINPSIPFIFVTGTMSEETAAETIKAGAWDYVVKDRLFRLPFAVRSVLKLKDERMIAIQAEAKAKRLLAAIEQTSAQIVVGNDKGEIEYANRKFSEVTGLSTDEAIGKPTYNLPGDNFTDSPDEISSKLLSGNVYRGEMKSLNKDGNAYWALLSVTPIKNEDGKITNFVAVKEDITERKTIEQELIAALEKAEKSDRLKDAFLQNLSHEIRTPLNAIVGFSNLLSQENASPTTKEYTSIIRDSSHQLLTIVSDILTISSIQTGQETVSIKPVNLGAMLNRLNDLFLHTAREKNLKFVLPSDYLENTILLLTDEVKLNQILTNLLSNAFKFTHKGTVSLSVNLKGDNICFTISDTGIGISKESLAVIFEKFRQGDDSTHIEYGGTGLGLSISKSFAQMLGGSISVESEINKGSSFSLTIPYRIAPVQNAGEEPQPVIPTDKKINILIAEDEINNYLLIKALLKQPNLQLSYAENGLEAVKICESNPKIDIVLMDIKMPVMDGIEAFNRIKGFRKQLPVIAQTAYGLEKEKMEFLRLGFTDYISKPIKKDILLGVINRCITSLS